MELSAIVLRQDTVDARVASRSHGRRIRRKEAIIHGESAGVSLL